MFYLPDLSGECALGTIVTLNSEESGHCARVLRLNTGDLLQITNGEGWMFEGLLMNNNPKACTLRVDVKHFVNRHSANIHLAVAPTKNIGRFEWFLEKATEIGIDEITPLFCQHSERQSLRIDRLNKIITAAVKQSLNAYHPLLHEPMSFRDFLKQETVGQKFIAYVDEELRTHLKDIYKTGSQAIVLIGPEGDFSPEEIGLAFEKGYQAVSLGPGRLRTETAAVVACHTLNLMNC
jgi:16S rRNA (uracil1498-N3)-methyltransferase